MAGLAQISPIAGDDRFLGQSSHKSRLLAPHEEPVRAGRRSHERVRRPCRSCRERGCRRVVVEREHQLRVAVAENRLGARGAEVFAEPRFDMAWWEDREVA